MIHRCFLILGVVVSCAMSGGCAMSRIAVEDLPLSVQRGAPKSEPVPVYEIGISKPPRAVIPFARLGAHGNGYATKDTLTADLANRAAQLGADCVILGGSQINDAGSVTSYGGGLAISSPVRTLSLYGTACVYSRVRMGASWDSDFKITDVIPASPADKAGMRIGDRMLAVGNIRVAGDKLAFHRVMTTAKPGDVVPVEVVASDNTTRNLMVTLETN